MVFELDGCAIGGGVHIHNYVVLLNLGDDDDEEDEEDDEVDNVCMTMMSMTMMTHDNSNLCSLWSALRSQ